MNEVAGKIFSIAKENASVPGCTISKAVSDANGNYVMHFSLAEGTNISAELYSYRKLWIVHEGELRVTGKGSAAELKEGEAFITPADVAVGSASDGGCVYTEITLKEESAMNEILKDKKVFALKDLIPYTEDRVINMDLIDEEKLKFVVMSFTAGTGLPEHAAPGDALVFALEGEATIRYEGGDYRIRAGENFKFAKGGAHSIAADQNFKMALLLILE